MLACTAVSVPVVAELPVFNIGIVIGGIALAGIIINNAIVLLDRIKFEIEEKDMAPAAAVIAAA